MSNQVGGCDNNDRDVVDLTSLVEILSYSFFFMISVFEKIKSDRITRTQRCDTKQNNGVPGVDS